jgi:glycosyltransferase involved in cell wall biosynthesis
MSSAVPPITVGLPVYNGELYIAEAIDSLLAQTFSDFELVISDNASTDRTVEILRAYAAADERIRLILGDRNKGAAWNYNRVFAECRSEFFRWAASDDCLEATCLERCHETLATAPGDVVLVAPLAIFIGPDGSVLRDGDDHMLVDEASPHARLKHVVRDVVSGNTAFGLMRARALRATRGHGAFGGADWVLLGELAILGQFWIVPERLFLRREHEGMSRRANRTPLEIARFMDANADKGQNELVRIYFEYVKGINSAPLARAEKLRCHFNMTVTFVMRHLRRRVALRTRLRRLVRSLNQESDSER